MTKITLLCERLVRQWNWSSWQTLTSKYIYSLRNWHSTSEIYISTSRRHGQTLVYLAFIEVKDIRNFAAPESQRLTIIPNPFVWDQNWRSKLRYTYSCKTWSPVWLSPLNHFSSTHSWSFHEQRALFRYPRCAILSWKSPKAILTWKASSLLR